MFYSKDYCTAFILHYDVNEDVLHSKCFDDSKYLKLELDLSNKIFMFLTGLK